MKIIRNEQGAALIVTLMFLMAMAVLSAAMVFTVQNEMKSGAAFKYSQQAHYVSNGGVQKAVEWFNTQYQPALGSYNLTVSPPQYSSSPVLLAGQIGASNNYPNGSIISLFSSQFSSSGTLSELVANANNKGKYAINATLLSHRGVSFKDPNDITAPGVPGAIERWRIESIGYWGSPAKPLGIAQITAIIQNDGESFFDRALWGKNSVLLRGGTYIDSYDPSLPYGGTNIGNMGAIGTNGTLTSTGTSSIMGDAACGPSGTLNIGSNTTVTGDQVRLPENRVFSSIPSFSVGSTDATYEGRAAGSTLAVGSYRDVTVKVPIILPPGDYYIDKLVVTAGGQLIVSGETRLFVKSGLNLDGQGVLNTGTDLANMTVIYSGTNPATMSGSSGAYVEMYAPEAPLTLTGSLDFYGSFIANSIDSGGAAQIHFNQGSLKRNLMPRPYRIITWSQNTN